MNPAALITATLGLVFSVFVYAQPVFAQAAASPAPISFQSFTATYYLSRDSNGHSLLTTDEVIVADFPADGNYAGITRSLPKTYQGHSVTVKVLSVKDVAGDPLPYKLSSDKGGDLVITTGDPSINLYGSQTIRIDYQTRDVVDTSQPTDQLLMDVNGRGWSRPFGAVTGILHIPSSFSSTLLSSPSCYIGFQTDIVHDCSITSKQSRDETLITAKSDGPVGAGHTLVIKTTFKPATFSQPAKSSYLTWVLVVCAGAMAAIFSLRWLSRKT